MKTRYVLGISLLSSLFTLIIVMVLLAGSGTLLAQASTPRSINDADLSSVSSPGSTARTSRPPAQPEAPQAGVVYQHIAGSTFVPMY